tara:strand:- start:19 stop:987 length:969 start_codon:yes stop_codon:yes gene_type:complete
MTSSFIGKSVVEGAKKAIPMAGQKLSEFFTKEAIGKGMTQAGNVAKEVGKQVMKAPGAIKTGAEKVGSVASSVGSEAAKEVGRIGMDIGGAVGGRAGTVAAGRGIEKVGELLRTPYALNTGVGIAAEQIAPRLMGGVAPSLRESVVRQGVSQGIGMPVSAGLMAGGINPTVATFGGQLAGQLAGAKATQAFVPPKYDTFGYTDAETGRDQKLGMIRRDVFESEGLKPGDQFDIKAFGQGPTTPTGATKHTAEPEYSQVVRPSTRDLSAVQAQEAITEREKYEYRLKLAQIEKMPSTVMHMNPDSGMQSLNSLAQSMMRVHNF